MKINRPPSVERAAARAANTNGTEEVKGPTELEKAIADGNTILDGAKGKFPIVVVIGLTDGNQLDITTNSPQYPTLQWILNRGSFELLLHEKQSLTPPVSTDG